MPLVELAAQQLGLVAQPHALALDDVQQRPQLVLQRARARGGRRGRRGRRVGVFAAGRLRAEAGVLVKKEYWLKRIQE